MSSNFAAVFAKLRSILKKHAGSFAVTCDTPDQYCLEAAPGPATLRAWGGKIRRKSIPVAWVNIGKNYVSYHVMGLYGSDDMSKVLKARMQGKTCFNFKTSDDALFQELDTLTARGLAAFRKGGFVSS